MNLKECWIEADCLRKRISRKEEELKNLRMCIDGMTGKGISNMPHTASPDPHKIEAMVSHILELEEEIKNSRSMLNELIDEMSESIKKGNALGVEKRDILRKRYVELKSWRKIADEMHCSLPGCYQKHREALLIIEKEEKSENDETRKS